MLLKRCMLHGSVPTKDGEGAKIGQILTYFEGDFFRNTDGCSYWKGGVKNPKISGDILYERP